MRDEERETKIASLSIEVGERLRAARMTLAAAESCTGGGLSDAITEVGGSSDYFLGSIVSYSNGAKEQLLGVDPSVLATYGAVSEPVARAMAVGVRRVLGSSVGVGITGIAGPTGGTAEKPVGLVYIGISTPARSEVRRFVWPEDRSGNKRHSVLAALELILGLL